ncbi:MAG: YigZ family protein [Planctomycetes bacterium]|nr:YigZ family protein [Planctomycetota bacterium]
MERYWTLAAELEHEIDKVKGSRFLATVAPVRSPEEAQALLERVRKRYHDARHHGVAWRLGPGGARERFSDDGEPAGSTGRPILAELAGRELSDAIVVVTRWFGGTKLGVGGLVRAYGGAAAAALDLAPRREVVLCERVTLAHPYECAGAVEGLLAEYALRPVAADYGAAVALTLEVPLTAVEPLLEAYRDRTAGRGRAARVSS